VDGIWTDVTTAPAASSTGSAFGDFLNSVVNLASTKVDQEAQRQQARTVTGQSTDPRYGVNEYGTPYLIGTPTFIGGKVFGVPVPLVLVGVGILAAAFILHGKG
jgi:hypothetical protein